MDIPGSLLRDRAMGKLTIPDDI